jgi:hypothetical protein
MRAFLCLLLFCSTTLADVIVERVTDGGLQPQVVTDAKGLHHMVYLKANGKAWDVHYSTRSIDGRSPAMVVNTVPATAVAIGSIRGARLALGPEGEVHVVWNGPGGKDQPSALFYARKLAGAVAFDAQRDLRGDTMHLDGGCAVATDAAGNVSVVWHAATADQKPGELNRGLWLAQSTDGGATFKPARKVNADQLGVCACCSLSAQVSPDGKLMVLYRAAHTAEQRDTVLLTLDQEDLTTERQTLGPWAVAACPMSSMAFCAAGKYLRAAWETEGCIQTALMDGPEAVLSLPGKKARHPALAVNDKGETLVAWSVGTGWQRGGDAAWLVLDAKGQPTSQHGKAPGVPVWGSCAVYARAGDFVLLY